jgi:hypothetical protein
MKIIFLLLLAIAATNCAKATMPDDPSGEPVVINPTPPIPVSNGSSFTIPSYNFIQQQEIFTKYSYLDPQHQIRQSLLQTALLYYQWNLNLIPVPGTMTVVDFAIYSGLPRMFVVNMKTGSVWALHVAHGKGSDPNNTGYATKFSNTPGSLMSSLGFYLTTGTMNTSDHGIVVLINGLSTTDSNAMSRGIFIHSATYVSDSNIQAGRSWGCFAVPEADHDQMVSTLKGGTLLYASN